LKKLAYWIHAQGSAGENEGGTIIKENDLIEQLRKEIQPRKKCEFDEAEKEAKRFIEFIRKRTGLLNEQGVERYAFVHKTFQEYLTAEEIYSRHKREDNTEIIWSHFRDHLHDQHWREVLLLLVSKLEGHQARKAIQTVLDAKSEYEKWLHRDLLFAGWCLTEDPPELTMVAEDFVGEILDRLVDLEVGDSEQIGGKIKSEAAKILHCFGETNVEQDVWAKLQAQGDRIDRFRLLEFQAALGQEAEVIDTLLSLLGDNNLNVCRSAARGLGQLGNSSPEVVNGLLSLLNDKELNVCLSAIQALGQLGNSSPEVVISLLSLLNDKELNVCLNAIQALGQLGNSNPKVVSRLLSLLNDKEWDVCSSAAEVLGQLGNSTPEVVNSLLSLLDNEEWDVRFSAAQALGRLGNSSPKVVSRLLSLLDDKELYVRSSAAEALVQLGNSTPEVVNSLLSLLDDKELILRRSAIQALGRLGNSTPEVVNSLRHRLNDYDSGVRASAAEALVQLGNSTPEVVNSLLNCLNDENSGVRSGAAAVLGGLAKTSDTIRPKVVQWLEQNPNHDGIGNAIDCLWLIVVE
jgi:HEAT repeat protein